MNALAPPKQKHGVGVGGDLMPAEATKTRATGEACTKEGHSYKPLPKEFRRDGFNYRQIVREGDTAIYERKWSDHADSSPAYEVVRIRRRHGFQIGGRNVEAAEVYPNSEAWGVDGFTFTDRNKARTKFFEISLEEPATRERR